MAFTTHPENSIPLLQAPLRQAPVVVEQIETYHPELLLVRTRDSECRVKTHPEDGRELEQSKKES